MLTISRVLFENTNTFSGTSQWYTSAKLRVPEDKIWVLKGLRVFQTLGQGTFNQVGIASLPGLADGDIYFYVPPASTNDLVVPALYLGQSMAAGWGLVAYVDSYVGTAVQSWTMLIEETDVDRSQIGVAWAQRRNIG